MLYQDPLRYDELHDGFQEDIPFWEAVARQGLHQCPGGVVVELACGTGRVAVPLAAAGIPMIALDNSPAMLATGRERAQRQGLSRTNPRFVLGDMADSAILPAVDLPVSAVIIPLHSLSHLLTWEALLHALTSIRRLLNPGGILALALHVPDLSVLNRDRTAVYPLDLVKGSGFEQTSYDPQSQVLQSTWWLEDERGELTETTTFALRMIFPQELNLLLHAAGFEIQHRYGWYDRTPAQEDQGTQIVIAQCP